MSACPRQDELKQMLAGQLEDSEEERFCEHVESCANCQRALEALVEQDKPRGLTTQIRNGPTADDPALFVPLKQNPPVPVADLWAGLEHARGHRRSLSGTAPAGPCGALPKLPGYEILAELGRGGMGVVYRARQLTLNRIVAVKTILAGDHANAHERARFQVEAEAAAGLQHPHIVQVHEIGEHEGRPFFSMEFVEGGTLQEKFRGRPQSPREAAELIELLARTVHYAHERGIVHRDLKPANILLESPGSQGGGPGSPKITDFGLAKILSGEMRHTRTGIVLGTPEYMAPEQAAGSGHPIGPACDIYALGVLLYEILTGRPPFAAATPVETLQQLQTEEPLPIGRLQPRVPHDLQTITHKCLQKDPNRRYASAAGLADDLRRFLDDRPILGKPPSILYQWRQVARRHKALVGGIAAVIVALAVGAVVSLVFALGEAQQRRTADANAQLAEENFSKATALTRAVDEARLLALRQAYQARLAGAQIALGQGDFMEMATQLGAAPDELRGWEWQELHARLLDRQPKHTELHNEFGTVQRFFPDMPFVLTTRGDRRLVVDGRTGAIVHDWPHGEPVRIHGKVYLAQYSPGARLTLFDPAGPERPIGPILRPGLRTFQLSPDGAWLATWWRNGKEMDRLICYDVASARAIWESAVPAPTCSPTFSPDGSRLAGEGPNNSVNVWLTASGEVRELKGHTARISGMAFSLNGDQFASISEDGALRQWDIHTGIAVRVRHNRNSYMTGLAFSPDGRWLATSNSDRTASVWPAESDDTATLLHPGSDDLWQIGYAPDGATLGLIDGMNAIHLMPAPAEVGLGVLHGHKRYVHALAYSPDGRWIASGGWEEGSVGAVRFWDARTGEAIPELTLRLSGFVGALAVTPDSKQLAIAQGGDELSLYDIATGVRRKLLQTHRLSYAGLSHTIAISPDGRCLACGSDNRIVRWDLRRSRELPAYTVPIESVRHVHFSPDGQHLAATGNAGLALIEAGSGRLEWSAATNGYSLGYSPDGKWLATSEPRVIHIWDTATGRLLRSLVGHSGEIFTTVFSPDGQRLASGGRDRAVHIWECATGDLLVRLQGHTSYAITLAFSPDGATLVSGSGDYTVRLWDTQPVSQRLRARREMEAAQPEAERLLNEWLAEEADPAKVYARLQSDGALSEPTRHALWRALLRHRPGGKGSE